MPPGDVAPGCPASLHPELREARDDAEQAWEALRIADDVSSRNAAHDKARAAIERARAVILAVEQHAAEADRIRTEAAREAYAFGVRLEAQQLATNQVIEERARAVLAEAGCTEATEGVRGFVFTTNPLAVRLRAVDSEGANYWPVLTETYGLTLEHCGWFAEPAKSHGLRLTPPGAQAEDIVAEGQRRSVETTHDQALAEHAQR
ncbi:hypothetical protein [Streptomyces sp. NPDC056468]|uniref:hypothetical protein n=1 Tax=Streptomyces sp. NPDC056468 TaxID=3345830 RepID=UPI0036CAA14B